ncbi:indoleamine 2,3-dioxygenase gamma type [Echria macrotheca]|uniref:Indoleamine 2,3-dioxygenase gamma type n=1 Tax=Echria macrotheca TaxID=438768 RepID=A0AAJ0BCN6_9PEZI|nr:indoleamine 2,3-dioxygenase gamma type [Echria macrotheca]
MATPFPVLDDPLPDNTTLPAFMVSTQRGFLPRMDPIISLPAEFAPLESLLQRMPIRTAAGTPGLLATGSLGHAVDAELPDLTPLVEQYSANLPLMNALYRDYSFLASAYLLEPCHLRFVKGEPYGLGRQILPANIARPISRVAEICDFKPFMEYAGSYALFNYRLLDPSAGLDPSNLRLIRAFEHGHDPSSSEAGFVLVHVDMARHSGSLVSAVLSALSSTPSSSRTAFNTSLASMLSSLQTINATMETMWTRSRPREYTAFRTFIFGITAQSMFPHGVIYEGISADKKSFRGESGANDSIIPLVDNFLAIPMPDTPLTQILADFRAYRPSNHRAFLEWVRTAVLSLRLKEWALFGGDDGDDTEEEKEEEETKKETRRLWLALLDQVRDFRWRHWCFAREYILKQTKHPTATGGSPIVTWLPNQLQAVLAEMEALHGRFVADGDGGSLGKATDEIMDRARRQSEMLRKEVTKFCAERGVMVHHH